MRRERNSLNAMRRGTKRRRTGFTLVEALITLLLVAVLLPLVMKGVSSAAQLGVLADRRSQAATLADTRLTEAILAGDWEAGDQAGEFDPEVYGSDAEDFQWYLLVDDWNGLTSHKEVTVVVTWQQRNREQSMSMATVVFSEVL